MNELIKINYDNADHPTVSGRELYEALKVETPYKKWFDRMTEYGFSENSDFWTILSESTGGRPATDHQLTIPMAKELCMLQRTDKGKQMRQYFIAVEEQWNSPDAIMARAIRMADQQIQRLETQCMQLETKVEQDKPKVLFADSVATAKNSILIGELAKILRQNGVETGQQRLFEWMRENGFLIKRKGSDYNMPTQKAMNMGLFEVKETAIPHADGHVSISKTPKVTGKGQIYFVHKLMGAEPLLPALENEKECHQ